MIHESNKVRITYTHLYCLSVRKSNRPWSFQTSPSLSHLQIWYVGFSLLKVFFFYGNSYNEMLKNAFSLCVRLPNNRKRSFPLFFPLSSPHLPRNLKPHPHPDSLYIHPHSISASSPARLFCFLTFHIHE